MRFSRGVAFTICLAAMAICLGGAAAFAADPPVKIATVDLAKLDTSPRLTQYNEQLGDLKKQLDTKLNIRAQNLLLADQEIRDLIELKTKDAPTDADKAKIKTLEEQSQKLNTELTTLEQTKELAEAQKTRLGELQQAKKKSTDTGINLQKDYEKQFNDKATELMTTYRNDAKEACEKVAKEKGYTVVLASDAVMFGGTDISALVIDKLDRKSQ